MLIYKKRDMLSKNIEQLNKKTNIFSIIRLILATTFVFFTICFLALENHGLYLILLGINAIILLIIIFLTNPFYHDLKVLKNLENVYRKHDNRRNHNHFSSLDDGREYVEYDDYKVLDLDILGPKSLYQYLCSAKTKMGKELLAKQLTNPDIKSDAFRECVYEFANDEDSFLIEASLNATSKEIGSCDYDTIFKVTDSKISFPKKALILSIICYIAFIAMFIILLINKINPLFSLIFFIINGLICIKSCDNDIFNLKSINYYNQIKAYEKLSNDILKNKINNSYFNELKEIISEKLPSLKLLRKTFDMLTYRQNSLLNFIGNSLLCFNYIVIKRFNKSVDNIESIEELIAAIAEIEVILSLANIGIDNEVYCLPKNGDKLYIEHGYHPLIKNCVQNNFVLAGGVIITGGNMAGKTTFQRMIGINQTLFNAGGLVCAYYFESKYYTIVSSLRANDMLQEGISTFYAEINRMKKIISTVKDSKDTLVLIDEIFKGTNSKDRIYSSLEIIKQLNHYGCIFIITTHDFELCEAQNILNYHFTETYKDDEIMFDYIIKEGKCNTTNARYLLKIAGVIN